MLRYLTLSKVPQPGRFLPNRYRYPNVMLTSGTTGGVIWVRQRKGISQEDVNKMEADRRATARASQRPRAEAFLDRAIARASYDFYLQLRGAPWYRGGGTRELAIAHLGNINFRLSGRNDGGFDLVGFELFHVRKLNKFFSYRMPNEGVNAITYPYRGWFDSFVHSKDFTRASIVGGILRAAEEGKIDLDS